MSDYSVLVVDEVCYPFLCLIKLLLALLLRDPKFIYTENQMDVQCTKSIELICDHWKAVHFSPLTVVILAMQYNNFIYL